MHDHEVVLPGEIVTHMGDRIPIYGHDHTICAEQSGSWSDPATWDQARVPNATDKVCVPVGLTVTVGGVITTPPPVTLEEKVADHERRLRVLEGLVPAVAVSGPTECLDVVAAGTLDLAPGFDFTTRTATVLPAGTFKARERGQLTFRDGVIDTGFDPAQFGHGLVCVDGTVEITGQPKTPWATLAQEIVAGDTVLHLAEAPSGWNTGDVLVLPDTRQPVVPADVTDANRRIEHVTVASVNGSAVTLAAPVQHAHLGWHRQDGTVGLLPDVGNLTRSIVFKSENPAGTRGHMLLTGRSTVNASGVELRDLGRTTVAPLHSTIRNAAGVVTQIGTNQIGRYAWHFHHCLGPFPVTSAYQFELTGSAINGARKWGLAVHGSYYGRVSQNVIDGFQGAGIVTETISEYATEIEDNLIIGRQGSGQRITDRSHRNDPLGDFWHGSVGLGLASASCTIQRNHIYDVMDGVGMAGFRTTKPTWPAFPGADPMVDRLPPRSVDPYFYPFLFPTASNQVWGCWRGIETWTADAFPDKLDMFPSFAVVHCHRGTDFEDQQETTTKAWRFLGDFALLGSVGHADTAAIAIAFKEAYEFGHTHLDAEVRGYDVAYRMMNPEHYSRFVRCTFECPTIVYQHQGQRNGLNGQPWTGTWESCTFLPVQGHVLFAAGDYPKYDINLWLVVGRLDRRYLRPVSYRLRPWRDGRNLDVFHWFQAPSYVRTPPVTAPAAYGDFPPGVNTHAQLIALGTPIFGAVKPDTAEPFGNPFFFAVEA